jgi:ElaB/YqjD/DUF883 family membrane-anchored ribosome-binding protein
MTTTRALFIVLFASLPFAALTARAFFVRPDVSAAKDELSLYTVDHILLEKVVKEVERPADNVLAVEGDPSGWRIGKDAANLPAPYEVAATLGRAGDAVRDADIGAVDAAIAEIEKMLQETRRAAIQGLAPAGARLVSALQDTRKRLGTHKRWIDTRAEIAGQLRKADSALADPPAGAGAEASLALLDQLKQKHPAVVADDAADEPAEARTTSEDKALRAIGKRASFRYKFQQAKRQEVAAQRQALLRQFVAEFGDELLDERDKPVLDDARKLLRDATLDTLWAQAQNADNANDLVQSLRKWLDLVDDPSLGANAKRLVDAWLAKRITEAPDAARFKVLQEGIIDGERGDKRLLGVFEKADPEGTRWRWWTDKDQKADPAYPRGDGRRPPVALKGKPLAPPLAVVLLNKYRDQRDRYLARPMSTGGGEEFAAACEELVRNANAHAAISQVPEHQHPVQEAYDSLLAQLPATLEAAARAAREFDAATRGSGLEAMWKP